MYSQQQQQHLHGTKIILQKDISQVAWTLFVILNKYFFRTVFHRDRETEKEQARLRERERHIKESKK
jgi:hypothetical protein